MPLFSKKTNVQNEQRAIAPRDGRGVAYMEERKYKEDGTDVHKMKTEFVVGDGTHGLMKLKNTSMAKNNMEKNDAEMLNSTTEIKQEGDTISQMKTVQSSYSCNASFTGTPEEIEKQRKKFLKEADKKKKEIEKKRKKMLKK